MRKLQTSKMTCRFTPEEKEIIRRGKNLLNLKRAQLALLLNVTPKRISNFLDYDAKIQSLPPKPKIPKTMIQGSAARIIHFAALNYPQKSIRDLHHLISKMKSFPGKHPSLQTLHLF